MNRFAIKFKYYLMKTGLGKAMRRIKHYYSYKREDAQKIVDAHWPDKSAEERKLIVDDMMHEAKKYDIVFDEYIFHLFYGKSQEERRAYISILEGAGYCERLNNPKNKLIFADKGETYRVFGKYFRRDQVEVMKWTEQETAEFKAFLEKHPRFIAKPYTGGNGIGIRIVDLAEEGPFEKLCETLKNEYKIGFVAEELIIQAKELSAVHASSVNTMRVITIRMDDRVEVLPCVWRVGRGGRCVDNGGSGGIFCILDDNGVIFSTADEHGNSYDVHPDTKHPLVGFQVPRHEEARELAKELAMVVPSNRWCGWDLALTEDGWVLQEANSQGGIVAVQTPLRRGMRKEIDALMAELGL